MPGADGWLAKAAFGRDSRLSPTATAKTWLQAAALRRDSLLLVLGQSNETRTAFRVVSVVRPQLGGVLRVADLPPLRYEGNAAGSQLKPLPAAGDSMSRLVQAIPVRTQPLRIIIYKSDSYSSDPAICKRRYGRRPWACPYPCP